MTGLDVTGLTVSLPGGSRIVDSIDLRIEPGKVLGLIGESGSGKTTIGLALLGHARGGARVSAGRVVLDGQDLLTLSPERLRNLRGDRICYVPQDAAASLNPLMTIGAQMTEVLAVHQSTLSPADRLARVREVLREVELPNDPAFLQHLPRQLSGGQQQRIGIAMAIAPRPDLVVLDEPTTGLDKATQARVTGLVRRLTAEYGLAAAYISHDLEVIGAVADYIAVLYAGRVVEVASTQDLLGRPRHPYSAALLSAVPTVEERRRLGAIDGQQPPPDQRVVGCQFAPRCPMRIAACTEAEPPLQVLPDARRLRCINPVSVGSAAATSGSLADRTTSGSALVTIDGLSAIQGERQVLTNVSLAINAGECLAIVGPSGSGKSTLSRSIIGLHAPVAGTIRLDGRPLARLAGGRSREDCRAIQYVFQNPYGSLQPRRTVGGSLRLAQQHFGGAGDADTVVSDALIRAGLARHFVDRFPADLSGGERQRVAIARALIARPRLLICDEVTSALDVSAQAVIVELLRTLTEDGLAVLFVTHNIAVVRSLADRVASVDQGQLSAPRTSQDWFGQLSGAVHGVDAAS
jgi:peptide/nickel transport system ATP-binding protein